MTSGCLLLGDVGTCLSICVVDRTQISHACSRIQFDVMIQIIVMM